MIANAIGLKKLGMAEGATLPIFPKLLTSDGKHFHGQISMAPTHISERLSNQRNLSGESVRGGLIDPSRPETRAVFFCPLSVMDLTTAKPLLQLATSAVFCSGG